MQDEVDAAELGVDWIGQRVDLLIARHITRQDQRLVERRRQLPDVLFEPLAWIRQRQTRARRRCRLRDRPGNRTLVGDAHDEASLAGQVGHRVMSSNFLLLSSHFDRPRRRP